MAGKNKVASPTTGKIFISLSFFCFFDYSFKIWQDAKAKEKKERTVGKLFDGIPPQLSALRYALDIAKKADAQTLLEAAKSAKRKGGKNLEFGSAVFELVKRAAEDGVEPESALRDYLFEIRKEAEKLGK